MRRPDLLRPARRPLAGILLAAALAAGCGVQEEDGFDDADLLGPEDASDAATEVADMGPALVVVARDPAWVAPADPAPCSVCQSCFDDGDCTAGESCISFDGARRCTALCSSGVCPGDSRCFDATDTGTGRTTAICLNPDADVAICDPSFECGPEVVVEPDATDDGSTGWPSGYASRCNTGEVCNYCGEPHGAVETCPTSSTEPACEVFRLVNQERMAAGLLPLAYNAALGRSAQMHAIDMAVCDYHEHDSLDGRDFADRELEAGYTGSPGGENVAAGQSTAAEVMESWMNSPGHRANILEPSFTEIGVGFYQHDPADPDPWSGRRWVQNFGRR